MGPVRPKGTLLGPGPADNVECGNGEEKRAVTVRPLRVLNALAAETYQLHHATTSIQAAASAAVMVM